jgi:hypothetical protein
LEPSLALCVVWKLKGDEATMANLVFKDNPANWRTGHDFPNVTLTRISWDTAPDRAVAYVFFGHVNIDFDGSPTAYGPPGITPMPDDDLKNAWSDSSGWFGVVALSENDPNVKNGNAKIDKKPALLHHGKYPVIQQAKNGDPKPGFYVSGTPHPSGPGYLQNSYIDSSQVAFGALSGKLKALGFSLGDYGLAIRHDENLQSGFYFVDVGGNNHALGECSHKVGKNLGGSGRASHFNNNFPVSFILFPGSFQMDPSAVAASTDSATQGYLKPLVRALSQASNADELPLLMGFNEVQPPGRPQGMSKLDAYRKAPSRPKPRNYDTIVQGLRTFGWAPLYTPTYAMSL